MLGAYQRDGSKVPVAVGFAQKGASLVVAAHTVTRGTFSERVHGLPFGAVPADAPTGLRPFGLSSDWGLSPARPTGRGFVPRGGSG